MSKPHSSAAKKTSLLRSLIRMAGFYVLLVGILVCCQDYLIYVQPNQSRCMWNFPEERPWLSPIHFSSEDGTRLHGWFAKPEGAAAGTILFCHGNGENVGTQFNEVTNLCQQLNLNVLVFDYRGFGLSDGKANEEGLLMDGRAAMRKLNELTNTKPEEVFILGRSLGGGVAVKTAVDLGAKGLILNSTYSAIDDVAASKFWWMPVRLVIRTRMRSVDWIANFRGPLLCTHGTEDGLLPFWSGKKLFDGCPSTDKTFYRQEGRGHHDTLNREFYLNLRDFIANVD